MAEHTPITAAMFWSKVDIPPNETDCWTWKRGTNSQGYGRFRFENGQMSSHRFSYEFVNGQIPEGLIVRHLCHNRLCVNPKHLAVGTYRDNAQDAIDAGRFTRGAVNGNSKLTDEMVVYIRQNPDKLKGRDLADKLGISPATVSGVKNGRVWRHVAA